MRKTKNDSSSVSLEDDKRLFCDFAIQSGRPAFAHAANLVFGSSILGPAQSKITRIDKKIQSAWSEVDYKEYPRFSTLQLSRTRGEAALHLSKRMTRRSCRQFAKTQVTLALVEEALGFAHADRSQFDYPSRSFPSAGGLYCTETYLIAGHVGGLLPGAYHYAPGDHALHVLPDRTDAWKHIRSALLQRIGTPAAFVVESIRLGPLLNKYGTRGIRFGFLEAGAAAQVFDLKATSLGLATLWLGGFKDQMLWRVLGISPLQEMEVPIVIIALGYERSARVRIHKSATH